MFCFFNLKHFTVSIRKCSWIKLFKSGGEMTGGENLSSLVQYTMFFLYWNLPCFPSLFELFNDQWSLLGATILSGHCGTHSWKQGLVFLGSFSSNCGSCPTHFYWTIVGPWVFYSISMQKISVLRITSKVSQDILFTFFNNIFEVIWVFWVHLRAYHSCLMFQYYCRPVTLKTTPAVVWVSLSLFPSLINCTLSLSFRNAFWMAVWALQLGWERHHTHTHTWC